MITIFSKGGAPARTLRLPEGAPDFDVLVRVNTLEGETAVEGDFSVGYYLLNGAPVPIPEPPGTYHTWDWDLKDYTGPHLELPREEVLQSIQDEKLRRLSSGFECEGYWFHSDRDSRVQYLNNKDSARDQLDEGGSAADPLIDLVTGEQVTWKTLSGSVPLTVGLSLKVAKASKAHEARLFAVAEQHKAAVRESNDPYAYDYSVGWPPTFEENSQ